MLAVILSGASTTVFGYEREVNDAAKQLSADFRRKNPGLDFRATLAIARFKTSNARLENNGTTAFVRDLLTREFLRSVYFEVVERENLEKITAEIELRQKGLTQGGKGEEMLKTADYVLLGELSDDSQNLTVSARLVRTSSGEVISAATTRIALDQAERGANEFRYNTFQSQYGITLGFEGSLVVPRGEVANMGQWLSVFVAYRLARPLRLGAGITTMGWNEFYRDEIAASAGGGKGYRNYSLSGFGPRFFADVLLPLHPRFQIGVRGDVVLLPGIKAEQDYSDANVWEFDNANAGAPKLSKQRVLVTGYSNGGMTIFKPAVLGEFLISSRLSLTASVGYVYSTVFRPFIFEAGGERHWAESEDINGTFAKYQNYNFARRLDGRPVQFQMGFVFVDIGLSLHF